MPARGINREDKTIILACEKLKINSKIDVSSAAPEHKQGGKDVGGAGGGIGGGGPCGAPQCPTGGRLVGGHGGAGHGLGVRGGRSVGRTVGSRPNSYSGPDSGHAVASFRTAWAYGPRTGPREAIGIW